MLLLHCAPSFETGSKALRVSATLLPAQDVKVLALRGRNIFLTGCGGSGKSFWIKHMIAHWEREGKEVRPGEVGS